MKVVIADTSFLIAVANPDDPHHTRAVAWLKEFDDRRIAVHLPTVAIAEFAMKGDFEALMAMGDFLTVEFALDDALAAGEILRNWDKLKHPNEKDTSRVALKDDFKILATAVRLKATHLITADTKLMTKVAKGLELCAVIPCDKPVDKSFFNKHGQHEMHLDGVTESPPVRAKKQKK